MDARPPTNWSYEPTGTQRPRLTELGFHVGARVQALWTSPFRGTPSPAPCDPSRSVQSASATNRFAAGDQHSCEPIHIAEYLCVYSPLALRTGLGLAPKLEAEAARNSTHSVGTLVALGHHEPELHIMTTLERRLQPALGHCWIGSAFWSCDALSTTSAVCNALSTTLQVSATTFNTKYSMRSAQLLVGLFNFYRWDLVGLWPKVPSLKWPANEVWLLYWLSVYVDL